MSGHTPGPWMLAEDLEPCGGCMARAVFAQDTFITEVLFDGPADPTAEANARLIAAAPTMLEALEKARVGLQRLMDSYLDYHDAHSLTQPVTGAAGNAFDNGLEARDQISAAILLAKGEAR